MWHYNKQKVIVLEGHWGSQTFANLHSNSEKKTIISFFYEGQKAFIGLRVFHGRGRHLPVRVKFGLKSDACGLHQCWKREFVKFGPRGWQVKPVGRTKREKKIEESFASFLCTTMQSGSSVVVCFTRNTLKKDMTKPSTIEFKVSSYSKVKKFRIRSLEDPEIRKLRIQKINKSVNSKIQIFG